MYFTCWLQKHSKLLLKLLLYMFCRSTRVLACTSVEFSRQVEGYIQHVDGHFLSHPQLVASGHEYNIDKLLNELNSSVETFNARGCGFSLDGITSFTVVVTKYRPLAGFTAQCINKKKEVINVKNRDNHWFEWSILSCLCPLKDHPCEVYNYRKYQNTLNFDNITFPIQVRYFKV